MLYQDSWFLYHHYLNALHVFLSMSLEGIKLIAIVN